MAEAPIREQQDPRSHDAEVIKQLINTIITFAARNLSMDTPDSAAELHSSAYLSSGTAKGDKDGCPF